MHINKFRVCFQVYPPPQAYPPPPSGQNPPPPNYNPNPYAAPGAYPPPAYPPPGGPTYQYPSPGNAYPPQNPSVYPPPNYVSNGNGNQLHTVVQTNIVTVNTIFGPHPVIANCSHCKQNVSTRIERTLGCMIWLMAFLFCCICICSSCIPCFVSSWYDCNHYCPKCGKKLGKFCYI